MPQKLESIGHYETLNMMRLGGRDLVLAFHPASGQYMTFFQESALPGGSLYSDLSASDDYLTAMRAFARRLRSQIGKLERQRRKVPRSILTEADCLPGSHRENYTGKLVILAPSSLAPEYRSSDFQLGCATGGFGCKPASRGSAVFFRELYSGETSRWDRRDILGIADPKALPPWAVKKLRDILGEKAGA